jgi:hypothetical protein
LQNVNSIQYQRVIAFDSAVAKKALQAWMSVDKIDILKNIFGIWE